MIEKQSHGIITTILMMFAIVFEVQMIVGMLLVGYFIGREFAQAEQRGISKYYNNHRADAPWYVGFELKSWNLDSFVNDLIVPILIILVIIIWM